MTDYSDQDWVEIQHLAVSEERAKAATNAGEVDPAEVVANATVPQPEPTRVTYQAFKEVWEGKGWTIVEAQEAPEDLHSAMQELGEQQGVLPMDPQTETVTDNAPAEEPKGRGGRTRKDDA